MLGEGLRAEGGIGLRSELIFISLRLVHRASAMGLASGSTRDLRLRLGDVLAAIHSSRVVAGDVVSIRKAVHDPSSDPEQVAQQLRRLFEALGESRAPQQEAKEFHRIFGAEQLAELLVVSPESLCRYARGARKAPSLVADRLHWLTLVVGDLNGTYNEFGVRRWFGRPRAALGGVSPQQMLLASAEWRPDSVGAREVERLAIPLFGMPAT